MVASSSIFSYFSLSSNILSRSAKDLKKSVEIVDVSLDRSSMAPDINPSNAFVYKPVWILFTILSSNAFFLSSSIGAIAHLLKSAISPSKILCNISSLLRLPNSSFKASPYLSVNTFIISSILFIAVSRPRFLIACSSRSFISSFLSGTPLFTPVSSGE